MHPRWRRILLTTLWIALLSAAGVRAMEAAEGKISLKDYVPVGFNFLGKFEIDLNDLEAIGSMTEEEYAAAKIPDDIKELDGKKVCIPAYMLPVVFADGGVTEFLGMASTTSCCYGVEPKLTEIIAVRMTKGSTQSLMDSPLFLFGTLRVGPVVDDGFVTAIYSMECDKVSW